MTEVEAPTPPLPDRAIWINGAKFIVNKRVMAVAELRELPLPPIPNEQVLYAETPPGQDDFGLYDEQVVDLDHTQRFFSAPRFIQASAPDEVDGRVERWLGVHASCDRLAYRFPDAWPFTSRTNWNS